MEGLICVRGLADKLRFIAGGVVVGDRERLRLMFAFSSRNIVGLIFSFSLSVLSAYLQHFRT